MPNRAFDAGHGPASDPTIQRHHSIAHPPLVLRLGPCRSMLALGTIGDSAVRNAPRGSASAHSAAGIVVLPVSLGIPWYSMVFPGVPWCSVVFHGVPWCSVVSRGIPWAFGIFNNDCVFPWMDMDVDGQFDISVENIGLKLRIHPLDSCSRGPYIDKWNDPPDGRTANQSIWGVIENGRWYMTT